MGACMWVAVGVMVVMGVGKQGDAFNFLPINLKNFRGPPGAQFGFSVALWSDANGDKRVVVGAPRGNQTGWGDDTFPLGVAYLCDADLKEEHDGGGGGGSGSGDSGGGGGGGTRCSVLSGLLPASKNEHTQLLLRDYNFTLRNYGMAIGQTIVSQKGRGPRLTVCAPRHPVHYEDNVANNGICFVMKDPARVTLAQPYNNKAYRNSLMGYSAATGGDTLVIGGPTAYNGCGLLVSCVADWKRCPYTTKYEMGMKNATIRRIKKACPDSHEGWAIQVGRFGGPGTQLSIATSSPKSRNYMGQISFYPLQPREWDSPLHTLLGNQTGALFGYALASADVDGDGASDLLVGAPLATGDSLKHMDAGKVFVYYAPLAQGVSPHPQEVLVGKESWWRFGISIAALGDVDLDGYEDVAVGAPYGGVDGSGVVFIYNGGEGGLRSTQPKLITASEYSPGARGFGFSIDGGLDMDDNKYPDMVIGALHSDTAVLVRASPVLRLQGSVFFESPTINIKENLCTLEMAGQKKLRGVCFDLTVNVTYSSEATFEKLKLRYKMDLSIDNGTAKFGFYQNTGKTNTREIEVNKGDEYRPWSLSVFVQRARSNVNLTLSATVSTSVSSYTPEDLPPMLDLFTTSTYNTSTTLVCRKGTTCSTEPDLALSAFGAPVTLGVTPMTVSVNVSLEVRNDPAYGIKVRINYPEHLSYQNVDGNEVIPECLKTLFKNQVTCTIEEGSADEMIDFWLVFGYDITNLHHLLPGAAFSLSVKNDVETDTDLSNNRVDIVVQMNTRASLYPQGFSDPEGVIVTVNQTATEEELKLLQEDAETTFPVDKLGPRLGHIFSLTNKGPSPVEDAKLLFHLPLYLGNARLTYIMTPPTASPGVTCTHPPINPLGLQPPQSPVYHFDSSFTTTTTTSTSTTSITSFMKTTEAQPQHQRGKRDVLETPSSLTTDSSTSSSTTFSTSFQWTTDPAEYFSTTNDPVHSRKA